MTPWEKKIQKRTANIGFITRLNAFREPSEFEKAQAIAIETKAWQESKGKKLQLSNEYSTSLGFGIDVSAKKDMAPKLELGIEAYLKTQMDPEGILKSQGIDITPYENPATQIQKIKKNIKGALISESQARLIEVIAFLLLIALMSWGLSHSLKGY